MLARMNASRPRPVPRPAVLVAVALAACALWPLAARAESPAGDPLAAELARWNAFLAADTASDERSVQVRQVVAPVLAQAGEALAHGRRLYALLRLSAARQNLAAQAWCSEHPEDGRTQEALEAAWQRLGPQLLAGAPPAPGKALAGVQPAAVRAMGEAAIPQVRVYYDASLEYGRATDPGAGLFYMGEAVAQQQFVALCRALAEPAAAEPAFRSITPELEALQGEMLAVYRPPVSIDRHSEFIGASSALKEARELDVRGFTRGALLRYLQAVLRFQPLRPVPPAFDAAATPARLAGYEARLREGGVDHSLGRLFLEAAQADLGDTTVTAKHATAAAIAEAVLPRYFAALEPAKPRPTVPPAKVTVTLVRWPYT
jgi:hypothetical protein